MRAIRAIIAGSLLCIASANAQWVVYDPALHTQNIIDEAQNIAKYVQMIDNQVQQINTLTSQGATLPASLKTSCMFSLKPTRSSNRCAEICTARSWRNSISA